MVVYFNIFQMFILYSFVFRIKQFQKHTFLCLVYFSLKFKLEVTISDFYKIDWD